MYQLYLLILSTCPGTLAERQAFTVCYDTVNQRALWAKHQVKPATAPATRKHWRIDRDLNSLPSSAFTNTGFDRGHLVTADDAPESPDTFLTSNAVAQDPQLNRGPWRRLENEIRKRGNATVLTGAIYNNCGTEKIEAPCVIYKIARFENGEILAHFAKNADQRH